MRCHCATAPICLNPGCCGRVSPTRYHISNARHSEVLEDSGAGRRFAHLGLFCLCFFPLMNRCSKQTIVRKLQEHSFHLLKPAAEYKTCPRVLEPLCLFKTNKGQQQVKQMEDSRGVMGFAPLPLNPPARASVAAGAGQVGEVQKRCRWP